MKHTTSSEIFDTPNRVCRGFLNAADCCSPAASASIILNCSLWWSLKWFRKLPVLFILPFTFFEHSLHSAVTFCPVKDNGVKYFKIFGNLFESIFELFVDWFEPIIQSMSFIYQTTLLKVHLFYHFLMLILDLYRLLFLSNQSDVLGFQIEEMLRNNFF